MNKTITDIIISLLFVCICAYAFYVIKKSFNLPIVQISNSTQECIKVIPESAGYCDDLPKKYIVEWTK